MSNLKKETFTITEGGYNVEKTTGEFMLDDESPPMCLLPAIRTCTSISKP